MHAVETARLSLKFTTAKEEDLSTGSTRDTLLYSIDRHACDICREEHRHTKEAGEKKNGCCWCWSLTRKLEEEEEMKDEENLFITLVFLSRLWVLARVPIFTVTKQIIMYLSNTEH